MAKPIAIQINDIHLKKENIEQVNDIINQLVSLCKELNISNVFLAGDVFDSRTSQRLEILTAFLGILDTFYKNKITCYTIPGNHDKTRYDSNYSFLDTYKYHPSLILMDEYENEDLIEGVRFHFMPFFKEDLWLEKFKPDLLENGKNVCITHVAITGSINNDGSEVESLLTVNTFKDFDRVFSGHYHDSQQIKNKFIHCPSPYQANFGEDNKKGFTVIYDDLTYEIKKAKFKEYKKVKVNIDEIEKSELDELIAEYSSNDDNIRFEVSGSENKVKALKKDKFFSAGIDLKTKIKEIDDSLIYAENDEIISYNETSLKEEFKEFCEDNELDFEIGNKYLERKLNG